MEDAPLSSGAGSNDVDAAGQTAAMDGSATATPAQSTEDPVQVQLSGGLQNRAHSGQAEFSTDVLAERLLSVLSRSGSFPAASGNPPTATELTVGMLQAVDLAVEQVWQTRKADLPTESGLKPKACAWLAADLMGDPFLPSEAATKLGKAMQTRAAALQREEKAERDKCSAERRAAEKAAADGGLEGSLDAAKLAAAERLQDRINTLRSTVYPAYNKATRPKPEKASNPPIDPEGAVAEDATAVDAADGEAEVATDANACYAAAETSDAPQRCIAARLRSRTDFESGYDEGYGAAEEYYQEDRQRQLAGRSHLLSQLKSNYEAQIAANQTQAHADADRAEKRGACDGALEVLDELEGEIDAIVQSIGRQVAGAFLPLKVWLNEKKESLHTQQQEEYSAEAAIARWDASMAKSDAIWWPNGYLR